ncbi:MAG: type II 3-dehydroquinate dehydratase [Candidatus Orphnella occulta]|nr:type II 3-dehydroquinate dehydratase [Candidatus Orphnella occulta]MDP8298236.1 type II 3-dehydroquinate dehydratase [Candidatus Orphnella occulta]
MKKVLVIHGPNLNLLGKREEDIYGKMSLEDINNSLAEKAKALGIGVDFFQSNHEGDMVQRIQDAKDEGFSAILINPAAYTHTSVALRDAVSAIDIPVVESHISNIYAREEFRHTSLIAPVAAGQIAGFGVNSYILGLEAIVELIK